MNRIEKIIEGHRYLVAPLNLSDGDETVWQREQFRSAIREAVRPYRERWSIPGNNAHAIGTDFVDEFAPLFAEQASSVAEEKPTLRSGVPKTEEPKRIGVLGVEKISCGCYCLRLDTGGLLVVNECAECRGSK